MDFFFTNIAYADGVDKLLSSINAQILDPLIRLLFAVAFIVFLWGVSQMVLNANSDEGRTKGKSHILWGVVGMSIMVSVWGILNILINTLGIQGIDPEKGEVELNDFNTSIPGVGGGAGGASGPTGPSGPGLPTDTTTFGTEIILGSPAE